MENIIEIRDLTKKYKHFAVNNISFNVEAGKITGLIGINGAGKTTIIKSIAGLIHYNSGNISFKNNITNEKIGYVLDGSHFYENLSIKEMKDVVSASYTGWDERAYRQYCAIFKLDQHKKIETLSKGMKMKFAMALALSHNAELLIMDEPTGGLDPLVRKYIMKVLRNFVSDGKKSVLFSTHIISDLENVADNIVFVHQGTIKYQGKLHEYLEDFQIVTGKLDQLLFIHEFLLSYEEKGDAFTGLVKKEHLGFFSSDIQLTAPSLEDIMLGVIASKNGRD